MKAGGAAIKHTVKVSEGAVPDNQIGYSVVDTTVFFKDGKVMDSLRYNQIKLYSHTVHTNNHTESHMTVSFYVPCIHVAGH